MLFAIILAILLDRIALLTLSSRVAHPHRRSVDLMTLHVKVEENREEMVKPLIDSGADVEAWGSRGMPLEYAVVLGRTQIAELLRTESETREGKERKGLILAGEQGAHSGRKHRDRREP
jgi:hypothetical protein